MNPVRSNPPSLVFQKPEYTKRALLVHPDPGSAFSKPNLIPRIEIPYNANRLLKSASEAIKTIKPNIFVKGDEYAKDERDKSKKIIEEKRLVKKYGGKVKFTFEKTFSSSKIINETGMILSDKQRAFINLIKKKISYKKINEKLNNFSKLKVLVIGEMIIDKYCFGNALGKSGKEPYLV